MSDEQIILLKILAVKKSQTNMKKSGAYMFPFEFLTLYTCLKREKFSREEELKLPDCTILFGTTIWKGFKIMMDKGLS